MNVDMWQLAIYAAIAVAVWLFKGNSTSLVEALRRLFSGGGGVNVPDDPNSILDDIVRLLLRLNAAPNNPTPQPVVDREKLRQTALELMNLRMGAAEKR